MERLTDRKFAIDRKFSSRKWRNSRLSERIRAGGHVDRGFRNFRLPNSPMCRPVMPQILILVMPALLAMHSQLQNQRPAIIPRRGSNDSIAPWLRVGVFRHWHALFTPMPRIPPPCSRRFCSFGCPNSVVHFMRRSHTTEWGQPNETHKKNKGQTERFSDMSLCRISESCHSWPREV